MRRGEKREARARREAFAALHAEHASGIYSLALRLLGNREDAQDVTQDVLLKAFQRIGRPGELKQRAWLYRVTVNACYDQLRARKRRPSVRWEPGFELDLPSTIDRVEQAELRRQLEEAFRRVPPAQRAALLLREIHGLHVNEVAFALGVKPESAEVTLVRARSSFRRHFTEISQPGVRWAAKSVGEKRRDRAAAPRAGCLAVTAGLPALALKAVPLPACLDASSVLAAGSSAGLGGGFAAAAIAKVAAALSTKAAVVAIGATVVAGSAGGLYTAERSSLGTRHDAGRATTSGLSRSASPGVSPGQVAAAPARTPPAATAPEPASDPGQSASPSAPPSASPTPLIVGESGGSPGSSPSPSPSPAPSDTASATPSPSPEPSSSSTPIESPSPTALPTPSPDPSASPAP
jgi:RNA polymerase sigma-70 factor, ECF subfamily